ncbi:MAG: hypothetical protein AAFN10_02265 [Bacteroidota bacterium]
MMSPEREHSESLRIEAYLAGQMKPEAQTAFEADCEAEPALQALLEEFLMARMSVLRSGNQNQKEQWQALREEMKASTPKVRPLQKIAPYLIAAAVLILLLWGGLSLFNPRPASPEQLFADFYERPQAPESMGRASEAAMRYYREENFKQATATYEAAAADSTETLETEAYLYWGIAYLEMGEADSALARFAELQNLPETRQWYEAMAYLKKGDQTRIRQLLASIVADEGHYYQAKAAALLEQLD